MLSMKIPLGGKAVITVEITCMGDQKTKRLDDCAPLFEIESSVCKGLFRKKFSLSSQRFNIVKRLPDLLPGDTLAGKLLFQLASDLLAALSPAALIDQAYGLVGELIRHMYTAAVDIQNDVITIEFILVDHILLRSLTCNEPCAQRVHGS